LKSTTTQITSAADDYLRAGKSMNEAQVLIKDSIMLSKLGQLDSSVATEDLLATMNGYAMSVEELERALDAMVAIDMEAATSSGDIATALKYCASSADVAGLSFNKLAAMIGAVQDKTQQSAETIGTFMNTLLSRYRDVKIGRFVDDDGESLSDVESVLNSLDIKLRDSSGEFREFETVIDEVAQSWNSYSSVQQAAISKAFSGVRQQNRFIALMEGYNKTLELTEVAANSAGTAVEKFNSAYMNSLEAKQNALQASFESMVINSDFDEIYSGILDATTALVDFINQTNALKGVFAGLAVSSGIKFFLSAKTGATEAYIALNKFSNALKIAKQTNISTADFDKLLLLSNNLSASQMKLLLSSKNLSTAQKELLITNSSLSAEEKQLQLQTLSTAVAETGLTVATTTLGNAFKGLIATLASNPFLLITMAVSGAVMAYQSYNQKLEETRRKNIEASEAAIEHANSLKDLYNEYNRLSSIQGRTTSEEEEFKTAVEDITKALGNKADVLEGLTAGTNEYADALAKATKEELLSASVNATVGRKSAEEELQNAIWDQWKGSLITVDSNSKGKALSEEAQKAVDIVSDTLKDFETINRTWNNLSWDGATHDDSVAIFEYYNALIKAREQLVLASQDDEALLNTEIYSDLNNAINTMSESMDTYINKRYEEEKLIYMAHNGIPRTTEEYKHIEDALINAAGSSSDLQDKFKELLMSDFSNLATDIESVGESIDNVSTQAGQVSLLSTQLTNSKETLDKFQSSVKSAYDAYSALMSGNYSSSELLDSIQAINQAATDMGKSFNWEAVEKLGATDLYDSMELIGMGIEYISEEYAKSVLSGAGIDVDSKFGQMLTNVIIQEQKASTQLGVLNDQIDSLQDAYNDLTDVVKTYNETGSITFDQLQTLLDMEPQYLDCLIDENGQLQLNKEAMTELANQRLNDAEAQAIQQAITELGQLALQDEKTAVDNNAQAFSDAVDDLADYNAELANTIAEATVGAAAIRDLNVAISGAESQGATDDQINTVLDNLETKLKLIGNVRDKVNSGGLGDALGAAKSASKKASDAYVEAFEKELSHLQDLRDRGVIDEAEYLRRLRELYTRYFADRKEYLDEFNKYEREYLEGMKSLYNSALSGISTLYDHKISAASDAKDAVIDALNEEKDAIEEAYQKQIDAIDELISKKQKQIDAINEEIKKIQDASKARKLNLDIQQQEYALAKMQNQKTQLLYKDGQFVYDVDTSGIREANEKLTELKEEKQISELEKQIDLIEKSIDLLEEQKSSIQKMMDESNKYYENLIKEQEKYWDSMIENLEHQKSKWEELADIEKVADAYSKVKQVFGELGYTVEDVLNGNEQAFEDFKSKYVSLMNDMNSNASFAEGLSYASGVAKEELGSFLDKTKETADGLDVLGTKGTELDSVASSMDNLSGSSSTASKSVSDTASNLDTAANNAGTLRDNLTNVNTAISEEQTAFGNLKQTINEVIEAINEKITAIQEEQNAVGIATSSEIADFLLLGYKIIEVKEAVTELDTTVTNLDSQTLGNITNSFQQLYDKIILVSGALGSGIEGSGEDVTNSISSAIQALNDISLEEGIIAQFNNLKTAIDSVTSAIGGGGGESSSGQGQSGQAGYGNSGTGGEGAANSLSSAITEMGATANEIIGEPETEGDGTVIGEFGSLKTAVNDVTEAIGIGGEEGSSDGGQSGDDGTLIGSINDLGTTTEEIVGERGEEDTIIGRFEQFRDVIGEADAHVHSISDGLDDIDGKEVECTIKINVETSGGVGGLGLVNGSMNLNSAEYNAKYGTAHLEGTALVQGNWAVQSEEKNALLAEIGPEIVVRDGRYHVIGLNGAEMFHIKPGDIVFNAEQSAALLKYGKISGRGKAYADGTVGDKFASGKLRPLQPGDRAYELDKIVKDYMAQTGQDIHSFFTPINAIQKNTEQMAQAVNTINNINNNRMQSVSIGDIHITCPGITSAEVANQVGIELERRFRGLHLAALQESMKR
ncbi:MAG: phage tail tape measure protein, partial [Lachnospiraceae bacterium]|nr:phage tail tape measure protein [Lachnospiraceae bacterium]